jgi:hypothetical protein
MQVWYLTYILYVSVHILTSMYIYIFWFIMWAEASFLEYRPSSIAAAAILCAANDIPNLSLVNPEHAESWCDGLSKVRINDYDCGLVVFWTSTN